MVRKKKSDITGASSSVKAAEIAKRPLVRMEQALQGTTAGVAVLSPNGQPGQGLRVKIRGANSITGGTEPLYVIDGNIGNGTDVNPADIESLEVLKDAASTAIYGSRASNGVVLITTKSGGVGSPKLTVNAWAQKNKIPRELDLMQAYDFARSVNAQFVAQGGSAASQPFSAQQLSDFKSGAVKGTDWQRALHTEPWVQNYQASLSGGSDNVRYYFSGGYLSQPGIILNQWYRKTTFRGNVDVRVNNKINVKFIVTGIIPATTTRTMAEVWVIRSIRPWSGILLRRSGTGTAILSNIRVLPRYSSTRSRRRLASAMIIWPAAVR
ncbi:TonB-dependent receptor plug domain-containing protein [Puia sp. P3]|uniref:TonB-dependent receptor plug domain-containing protein n=1 Tax=Puia sp. P3 TaxID=3423952 RepID=UPI003D6779BD